MLYLSRKIGESIVINNNITMTVVEVRGKSVKLGFEFPSEATVLRKEIHDKIMTENMAAMVGAKSEADLLDANFDLNLDMLGAFGGEGDATTQKAPPMDEEHQPSDPATGKAD